MGVEERGLGGGEAEAALYVEQADDWRVEKTAVVVVVGGVGEAMPRTEQADLSLGLHELRVVEGCDGC